MPALVSSAVLPGTGSTGGISTSGSRVKLSANPNLYSIQSWVVNNLLRNHPPPFLFIVSTVTN